MRLQQRLLAELLGTAGLLIVVVGSGIMGETLSRGNQALTLLANSLATGAGLYALIQSFAAVSGAHFNPVVSFFEFLRKRLSTRDLIAYGLAQSLGAIVGVMLTHALFAQEILQLSTHDRSASRFLISEVVATAGLLLVITLSGKQRTHATPSAVALYVTSAYWCTSSTSFANPAVTIARSFSDTFAGIQWNSVPGFIAAQIAGALAAYGLTRLLER